MTEKLVAVQGHGTWQEYVLVKAEHLARARSPMHEVACDPHVAPVSVGCALRAPTQRSCIGFWQAPRFCSVQKRLSFLVQSKSLPVSGR